MNMQCKSLPTEAFDQYGDFGLQVVGLQFLMERGIFPVPEGKKNMFMQSLKLIFLPFNFSASPSWLLRMILLLPVSLRARYSSI